MIDAAELQNILSNLPDPDWYHGDILNVAYADPDDSERMRCVRPGNGERVSNMTYRRLTFIKRGGPRNYRWCLHL